MTYGWKVEGGGWQLCAEAEILDVIGSFPPCYSQSHLLADLNFVYGNLKSENSQDYAQKPHKIVRS
jgi:hypothetical protein